MIKPLIIDFDYRIIHSASGQIARVFWETNREKNFAPTIVCSYQDVEMDSGCDLIQVKECDLLRYISSAFRRLGFPDLCHIPDQRRFSWAPFALQRLRKTDVGSYDYIHSISCPESSHMVALELKKKYGLPWVAQFNDPWVENEAKSFRTDMFRGLDERYEAEVAEHADLIIHTNRIMYENWSVRYGDSIKEKMIVLPLSFNVRHLPEIRDEHEPDGKFRIFHIGHLYGKRSAKDMFEALALIKERCPLSAEKIELSFIGTLSDDDMKYAQKLGISDMVKYLGVIHPDALASYYMSADMFLVIDMNVPRSPSFPSKLMLYHYYRKPIMSITTDDSIIEDDMRMSGHKSFLYGDAEGIASYLCQLLDGTVKADGFDRDYWRKFTVENVTELYLDRILKLISDESDIDNRS